jgi:hypothetical protein
MYLTFKSLEANAMFFTKDLNLPSLLLRFTKVFSFGYDSNSRAYRIFNKYSSFVETTCDVVFDETNDFQQEQYDLDVVDDKEAPCDALRRMSIGDVRPQELNEDHPSSNEVVPPIQANDKDQEDEQDKDQGQDQNKRNDQRGGGLCKMKRKMIKRSQDHHHLHTQKFDKPINVITPSTTYLVI